MVYYLVLLGDDFTVVSDLGCEATFFGVAHLFTLVDLAHIKFLRMLLFFTG